MHELDHLLWEEQRLSEGERRFAALTGITPAFGGRHPDMGTHNSLLSLGQEKYLEIIALDPAHLKAANLPEEKLSNFTPGLFAFGVRTYDLLRVGQLVGAGGLKVSDVRNISRQSPDGQTLTWQTVVVEGHDFENLVPFFTLCGDMLHPSETAPKGCELLEFSVGHPQHRELSRLYAALEVNVPVRESEQLRLRAVLATPKGEVVLDSSGGV